MSPRYENKEQLVNALRSGKQHVSHSSLGALMKTPEHFLRYFLEERKPATPYQIFGNAVETLLLEPDTFRSRFVLQPNMPNFPRKSKDQPLTVAEQKEALLVKFNESNKRQTLSSEDLKDAIECVKAIKRNKAAMKVLDGIGEIQKRIRFKYHGFWIETILDGFGESILELKTTKDAHREKFQRDIINYRYWQQVAIYTTAVLFKLDRNIEPYIIAVDREYSVSVHKIDSDFLFFGFNKFKKALIDLDRCIIEDSFNMSHDFYSEHDDGYFLVNKPNYLV